MQTPPPDKPAIKTPAGRASRAHVSSTEIFVVLHRFARYTIITDIFLQAWVEILAKSFQELDGRHGLEDIHS